MRCCWVRHQPHDFILAEHGRQLVWHLREDEIVEGQITPPQRALAQEPQRETRTFNGAPGRASSPAAGSRR